MERLDQSFQPFQHPLRKQPETDLSWTGIELGQTCVRVVNSMKELDSQILI
jgi:hypothetical protein